jgi:hypothetical protein
VSRYRISKSLKEILPEVEDIIAILVSNEIQGKHMKLFISILLAGVLLASLSVGLDEEAMKIHDASFERAMVAFGLAKGLNSVISLLQGTEFTFTPVGVGFNFSIGEVLDPLNDMVERFSLVMLFASISLGIQKLLLILSTKMFLQVVLALSIVTSLLVLWIKKAQNTSFFVFSMKMVFLLLILRFAAVLFVYSSEYFYNSVLQSEFQQSSAVIEKTKVELENLQKENRSLVNSKKESGFFNGVSSKYDALTETFNISAKLESLQKHIEDASRKIINLITIFVVQSIIMPLLFLWLFLTSVRYIFRVEFDNEKVTAMLNSPEKSI